MQAVALSGSPAAGSSSRRLAERVLAALAERDWTTEVIALSELPADALLGRSEDGRVRDALAAVGRARVLVVATPVYRATYTGLLKLFFDLMPPDFLAGTCCVPIATAAASGHMLAVDHGLRPLIASLGGLSVSTGIYAGPDELVDGAPSAALEARLITAASEADRVATALADGP